MSRADTILFRVDTKRSGARQRFERCLIIAETHIADGGRVAFALDASGDWAAEILRAKGLSAIAITAPCGTTEDLEQFTSALRRHRASSAIVDGPSFSSDYLAEVADTAPTAAIDDRGMRAVPTQVVVNPGFSAENSNYCGRDDTRELLGPQYQFLAPHWQFGPRMTPPKNETTPLRVYLETSDDHTSARILDNLPRTSEVIIITLVGSPSCPILDAAARSACARGYIIEQILPSSASDALLWCDAAIQSVDCSMALASYLGIPTLALAMSGAQLSDTLTLAQRGATFDLPPLDDIDSAELECALGDFLGSPAQRAAMGTSLALLVDGKGAERLLEELRSLHTPSLHLLSAA